MKILIAVVVSLLLGIGLGFYIGYRDYEKHVTNEAVNEMMLGMESSKAAEAALATRAIEFIDSGKKERAIQILSYPIADYYLQYENENAGTNEQRLDLRAMIEELAKTNQVVAGRIKEFISNYSIKTP